MDKQKKEAKMNKKTFINSFLIAFYLVYGTSSVMSRMEESHPLESSRVLTKNLTTGDIEVLDKIAGILPRDQFEAWKSTLNGYIAPNQTQTADSSPEEKGDVISFTEYKTRTNNGQKQKVRLTLEEYKKAENSEKRKILKEYADMVGEDKFHKETKGISRTTGKTEAVEDYMLLNGETHKSLKKRLKNGPVDLKLTASKQNMTAETQAHSASSQNQGEKPRKKFFGLF